MPAPEGGWASSLPQCATQRALRSELPEIKDLPALQCTVSPARSHLLGANSAGQHLSKCS